MLLPGCSGSDSGNSPQVSPPASYNISGTASKGPINKGTVTAYKVENGKKTDTIAETTSDDKGNYTISAGTWRGAVLIEVSGGSYKVEATGKTLTIQTPLRAAFPEVDGEIQAAITPLTEIAVRQAERAGFTDGVIRDANEKVSQLLDDGDILTSQPGDFFADDTASEEENSSYTLLLATLSQMQGKYASLDEMMQAVSDDLNDQKPDQIKDALIQSVATILSKLDDKQKEKYEDAKKAISDSVSELAENGFAPTGDLKEAKEMLQTLLASKAESDADKNLTAFLSYMEGFVADTPEAHLLKGAAIMAGIYESDAMALLTDSETGLGLPIATDGFLTSFNQEKINQAFAKLILLSYEDDLQTLFTDLDNRLMDLDTELSRAQGVDFAFSLSGFSTVYFDDIDVSVMRGVGKGLAAVSSYIQALDLATPNMTAETAKKIETLHTLPTEQQMVLWSEILNANPKLLSYKNMGKLQDLQDAVANTQKHFDRASTALAPLTQKELQGRYQNALNVDSELDRQEFIFVSKKNIPSVIQAFEDPDVILSDMRSERNWERPDTWERAENNMACPGFFYDIFSVALIPAQSDLTIHSFVNGTKTARDYIFAVIAASKKQEKFSLYKRDTASAPVFIKKDILILLQDSCIPAYEIKTIDVKMDQDVSEWADVPAITKPLWGFNVKLAQTKTGHVAIAFLPKTDGEVLSENFSSYFQSSDSLWSTSIPDLTFKKDSWRSDYGPFIDYPAGAVSAKGIELILSKLTAKEICEKTVSSQIDNGEMSSPGEGESWDEYWKSANYQFKAFLPDSL